MTLEERLLRVLQAWRASARDFRRAQNQCDSDSAQFDINEAAAVAYEKCSGDLAAALAARNSPPRSRVRDKARKVAEAEDGREA
jgi:hypothetical protein